MKYENYSKINLYGLKGGKLEDELQESVIHFAKKHGVIPDVVLIHPDRMPEGKIEFEVVSRDTGESHMVHLVKDPEQLLSCIMVAKRGD